MYGIIFKPQAEKELKKLAPNIRLRIINKLKYYLATNNPLDYASSLKDNDLGNYRFRVGDYRIIFDVEEEIIVILTIGHRREIYK